MTKIAFAKNVAEFVVGTSVSFCVGNVIRNNVNPGNIIQKGKVFIGSAVIGAMVAEQSRSWTDQMIDNAAQWWKTRITE